jgi:Site-specific recombinase XerD
MTLTGTRDAYLDWLYDRRGHSPHTVRAYRSDIEAMIRALGAKFPISSLTSDVIQCFLDTERDRGICVASLRRRAAGIRGFCRFLVRQGWLPEDPWPSDAPSFPLPRTLPRALAADDLTRLLKYLIHTAQVPPTPRDDAPLANPYTGTTLLAVALMLATGLRVGELVSFRVSDLDLAGRSIQVTGKGRKERVVYLTDDWLTHLVAAYLVTRQHLNVRTEQFMFNTSLAALTTASVRARLTHASRECGLRQHVTPHMLRHSAATQLIEAGVDIRVVQRLLGHASIMTTEIYTHVTDHALRRAVSSAAVLESIAGVARQR